MNNKIIIIAGMSLLLCQTAFGMKKQLKIVPKQCLRSYTTNSSKLHDIFDYDPKFANPIKDMTMPYVAHLATMYSFDKYTYELTYKNDIQGAFESDTIKSKIYCIDGNPAGYVNYSIQKPLYANMFFKNAKIATIEHLLTSKKYQKQGIAKQLITYAINDCKKLGAHKIKLKITLAGQYDDLPAFYQKFGFKLGRTASIAAGGSQEYYLTITQNPFQQAVGNFINKLL